jgi:hypothetical protein
MDEFTNIKPDLEDVLDKFEAFTDESKDMFECNLDCRDCSVEDLKACVQNFRMANVYILTKVKMYEQALETFIESLSYYVKSLLEILRYQIEDEEEEEEKKENDGSNHQLYA